MRMRIRSISKVGDRPFGAAVIREPLPAVCDELRAICPEQIEGRRLEKPLMALSHIGSARTLLSKGGHDLSPIVVCGDLLQNSANREKYMEGN